MSVRNRGLSGQQTLVWNDENRLSQVQDNNGDLLEQYWYDVDGARVKKTSGTTTTYTFFAHYEEEVTGVVTTTVSHYSFGGMRIAVKRGSDLFHLHGDHLGSTSLTTDGAGAATANRTYYAYGSERSSSGTLQTDRTFTGQKSDTTGLMYYNARYYDPALGTFISPDTIVPDPKMVIDYNRFLYTRGNPHKYIDPSGNLLACVMGGAYPGNEKTPLTFFASCDASAALAEWSEKEHGEIVHYNNQETERVRLLDDVIKAANANEPIVLNCFSWAAENCISVAIAAQYLNIDIDLMIMTEGENFGRWVEDYFEGTGPIYIPASVLNVRNYFAVERRPGEDILWDLLADGMANPQNGANKAIALRDGVSAQNHGFHWMELGQDAAGNTLRVRATHNTIIAKFMDDYYILNIELIRNHANDLRMVTDSRPVHMGQGGTFTN